MHASSWQHVDWRQHQRWVTVRSGQVNAIEMGEGHPLVFVHGLGGSWHNWLEQLAVFAREHRVVAFDLPGFGASPMHAHEISVPGYVVVVEELLDALAIDRATVVGNSMGGLISAELALAAPERVARLALISPAGIALRYRPQQLPKILLLYPLIAGLSTWVGEHAEDAARRARLRRWLMRFVASHPEDLSGPLAAEQIRGVGKPAFRLALESLIEYSIGERLPGIACPTLIVWGEHDHVLPVRHADVYAEAIKGARKVILPHTAHVAMLERPTEFNGLLAELLQEQPAAVDRRPRQEGALPHRGSARERALGGTADEIRVLAERHLDSPVLARRRRV
jgi:pimeloyl-ACP methyl ester carboxylesterase